MINNSNFSHIVLQEVVRDLHVSVGYVEITKILYVGTAVYLYNSNQLLFVCVYVFVNLRYGIS